MLAVFFYATSITDLSSLINQSGICIGGEQQLLLYIVLILALGTYIASTARKSIPSAMLQVPANQRKLSKRTLVAAVLIVLCIPLTILTGVMYLGNQHYNIIALLVLAGVLFRKGLLRRSRGSLATFGAFSAVIIYGGIMNPAATLMYNAQSINWEMLKAYYVSGLPMDLIHAAATVIFILIAAEPMLEKLDRIKVKYGLVE